MKDVYVLAHGRTPIGSLLGELCELSAVELASQCAKGVLDKYNINPEWIDEMFLGNVISRISAFSCCRCPSRHTQRSWHSSQRAGW